MDVDEKNEEITMNDEEFLENQDSIINQIKDLSITTHNKDLIAMYNDVVELDKDIIKKEKIKAVDISEITKYISKKYSTEHNNKLFTALLDAIGRGNNKLSQNMLEQTLDIKSDWVDSIQDGIIAMQKIVAKPKLALREERDLVKVERAKRVDAVAVRHLSTHTQFIKLVRDDGSVVPSNIMTRNLEDEMAIYENRFIYALLQRLKSFVGKRYSVIMEHAKIKDNIALSYTSNFKYGRAEIDCRLNVGVKMDKEMTQTQAENIRLLNRLKFIKDQIASLEASQLMRAMRKAKPLLPPIQRTNILKSNPEYSLCYNLWIMLSNYDTVGYSVNLVEKQLPFDDAYYQDLTKIAATSTHVMLINNKVREAIYAQVRPTKVVQKEFKVRKASSFLTNVFSSKRRANNKDINDFYYQRMKSMILNLSNLADALSVSSERDIPKKSLFKSIFKQVQQINNDMYTDILKLECLENDKKEAETLQEKYEMQKKLCERYNQLTQLKQEEVKKALSEENAQLKKLEKLERQIEKKKLAEKLKAKKNKQQQLEERKNIKKQKEEERRKEKEKKLAELKKEKEKKLAEARKEKERKRKEKEKKLLAEKRAKERKELQEKKAKEKARLAEKKAKEKALLAKKKAKEKELLAKKKEKEKQLLAEKSEKTKKKSITKKVVEKKATEEKIVEEKITIVEPVQEIISNEPVENNFVEQPIDDNIIETPAEVEEVVEQPIYEEVAEQSIDDDIIETPAEIEEVVEQLDDNIIGNPEVEEQPNYEEVVENSVETNIVEQPVENIVENSIENDIVKEPEPKKTVNKKVPMTRTRAKVKEKKSTEDKTPIKETIVEEPVKRKIIIGKIPPIPKRKIVPKVINTDSSEHIRPIVQAKDDVKASQNIIKRKKMKMTRVEKTPVEIEENLVESEPVKVAKVVKKQEENNAKGRSRIKNRRRFRK